MNVLASGLSAHSAWADLGLTSVHFIWQGAVLAGALAIILELLRCRSAAARYVVCLAVLGAMLLCPAVTFLYLHARTAPDMYQGGPFSPVDVTDTSAGEYESATDEQAYASENAHPRRHSYVAAQRVTPPGDASSASTRRQAAPGIMHRAAWLPGALALAGHLWSACAFVLAMRLAIGWVGLVRLRRDATSSVPRPILDMSERIARRFGIHRAVAILGTERLSEPVVVGLIRPAVLLPMSLMMRCPVELVEAVIAHELAHIRRHDLWVNLLQRIVETLLFYHPAVWWVSNRLRIEREHCCDDLAVGLTRRPEAYAEALLTVGRLRVARSRFALATGALGQKYTLTTRVRRVLQVPLSPAPRARFWLAGPTTLALVGVVGLLMQIHRVDATPAPLVRPPALESLVQEPPVRESLVRGASLAPAPAGFPSGEPSGEIPTPRPAGPGSLNLGSRLFPYDASADATRFPASRGEDNASDIAATRPADRERQVNGVTLPDEAGSPVQWAEDHFRQALRRVPRFQPALQDLASLNEQGATEGRDHLLNSAADRRTIAWQRTLRLFESSDQAARRAANEHDYEQARRHILTADTLLQSARSIIPSDTDLEQLRRRLASLNDFVDRAEQLYHQSLARQKRDEALAAIRERQAAERTTRDRQITEALLHSDALVREGRLSEAIDLLHDAQDALGPVERLAERIAAFEDDRDLRQEKSAYDRMSATQRRMLADARDTRHAPATGLDNRYVAYPDRKEWQRIAARDTVRTGKSFDAEDRRALEMLGRPLPDAGLSFPEGSTFGEVMHALEQAAGVRFNLKWSALGAVYVTRDEPIVAEVDYNGLTLEAALADLLDSMEAATGVELDFDVRDGRVVVSTYEDLNSRDSTLLVTYNAARAIQAFKKPRETPYFGSSFASPYGPTGGGQFPGSYGSQYGNFGSPYGQGSYGNFGSPYGQGNYGNFGSPYGQGNYGNSGSSYGQGNYGNFGSPYGSSLYGGNYPPNTGGYPYGR